MSALADLLVGPFVEFGFMRRALVAACGLALSCGPVGVFLNLRRMTLVGDAMQHAILPGVAAGFLLAGLSTVAMSIGGLIAGLLVAFAAGVVSRRTHLREDAAFGAHYMIALALGVTLISVRGTAVDLMHVLFGNVLAVDDAALLMVAAAATVTLLSLAVGYRPLVADCFDPGFLRSVGAGRWTPFFFLALLVLNLVAGFQALGTVMALGFIILPAVAASFWARSVWGLIAVATGIGLASAYLGLLVSFHVAAPSGPAIVLAAGVCYLFSLMLAKSIRRRWGSFNHP